MNQILITGDEYGQQPKRSQQVKKQPKMPKEPKTKNVISINPIVIFFAISIIILGICMITGSAYANAKINETVEANTKPTIELTQDDENSKVIIKVTHIRGITEIAYKWNDEEENIIQGNNNTEIEEEIDLIGGENTLTIQVTEENGQSVSYSKVFTASNIELQTVSDGVQITVTNTKEIDYVSYQWDSNDAQIIEVGDFEYEGTIAVQKGKHTLTIEVVDIDGKKMTRTETVIGDTAPTLNLTVSLVNENVCFIIDASDDEEIEKVEITLNDVTETIEVNDTTYYAEIPVEEGSNKIKVTVYNINGLETVKGGLYNN